MRIGEILVGSSLVNTEQLDEALNYAKYKQVPVGRALRVLRYLSEDNLSRAIDAQKAIRKGLDGNLAVSLLKIATDSGRTFSYTMEHSSLSLARVPRVLLESILEKKLPRSLDSQIAAAKEGKVEINYPPKTYQTPARPQPSAASQKSTMNVDEFMLPTPTPQQKTANTQFSAPSAPQDTESDAPPARAPVLPKNEGPAWANLLSDDHRGDTLGAATKQHFQEFLDAADKHYAANDLLSAEKAYAKALEAAEAGYKPSNVALVLTKLANFYLGTDRLSDALPLYQRSLEINQKVFGNGSPQLTRALEDLGELYYLQGKLIDAKRTTEEALKNMRHQDKLDIEIAGRLLRRLLSITWRSGDAMPRTRLGELAVDAFLISREQMQTALQNSKQTGAPLGTVLRTMQMLDEQQIESLMFAQLLIKQSTIPPSIAVHAIRLAVTHRVPLRKLCEAGKFIADTDRNSEQYQQLVSEQEKFLAAETKLGPEHAEVARIAHRIADIHLVRKDKLAAELLLRRAVAILEKTPNADRNSVAQMCEKLAAIQCESGRHAEAQPLLFRSLELRQAAGSSESLEAAQTLWQLAKVELAQYNPATALSFLRSARAIFEKLAPQTTPRQLLEQMSSCCLETGITSDLEPVLRQLIAAAQKENRGMEPETADYMEWLGDLYLSGGKHTDAHNQFKAALEIHEHCGAETKALSLAKKLSQSSSP